MNYFLSVEDVAFCDVVAGKRHMENLSRGQSSCLSDHMEGCYGEFAVSRKFGLPWEGIYYEGDSWGCRGNDVRGVEVKASFTFHNLALDLRDPDLFPDKPFVFLKLLRINNPDSLLLERIRASFRGWIWGWEACKFGTIELSRVGERFILVDRKYFRSMRSMNTFLKGEV